jgi:phosphopantothenoylcysteine decarboxylase/phosphopantothenate--cysteine ligase
MKLLITAGATREPLDAVRFISNVSTGFTGAALADALSAAGHAVTLLHGEEAEKGNGDCQRGTFSSAADLFRQLQAFLAGGEYDAVIMAAAVSDYRPAQLIKGKISSGADELTVRLVRNTKILPQLKRLSAKPLRVVGFKLTSGATAQERQAAVASQFAVGGVDVVVQNDLQEIRAVGRERHPFRIYQAPDAEPNMAEGAMALATALAGILAGDLSADSKASARLIGGHGSEESGS